MKRFLLLTLALVLVFCLAACGETNVCQHRDANDDGFCDKCSEAYADGKDVADDPTEEDPTEEVPTEDDPTEEDPTKDDPTTNDPTKDDPTTNDPTKDDPTKDDPTNDDPNADKPDDDELRNYGVHYYLPEGFEYMKTVIAEFYYTDGKASIYFNHFDKEHLEEMGVEPGISVYNYTRQFAAWNSIPSDSLSYDAKRNIGTVETVSDFGTGAEAEYLRFQIMRGGDYLYVMTASCPEDDQEKYSTVFDEWFGYVYVDNAVTDVPSPDECAHIDGDKNGVCDVCGSKVKDESLSDYEKILEKGYFVCGVTEFPPFNYTDENGNWVGFDTEFAMAVAKVLGVDVKFQMIDWYQKYDSLKSGAIDCIWNGFNADASDNGINRIELVDFTVPYYEYRLTVVVPVDKLSEYKTLKDFVGKTAVCEAGSAGVAFAEQLTCDFDKVLMMDSQNTALIEVQTGAADFAVVEYGFAKSACENGSFPSLTCIKEYSQVTEIYAIGCRKDSDFDDKLNEAIKELTLSGILFDIAKKYGVENNICVGDTDIHVRPNDPTTDDPTDDPADKPTDDFTDEPTEDKPPEHKHIPSVTVEENRTEPTCTKDGSFDAVMYCDVCGDELSRETHFIPTLPHIPGDPEEENRIEPGCEPGSYEMVVRCGVCDEEMSRLPYTIEAVHNFLGKKCVDCGAVKASEGLTYVWNAAGDAYEVMKGACTDTEIGIPAYYDGTPVVAVRDNAFKGDTSITSVVIADGVESIGKCAFYECTALVDVDIPESVKNIGAEAFYCTSVTRVSLPGVVTVGDVAFKECEQLTEVIFGDALESIGSAAFGCCPGITEISFPESLLTIGGYSFQKTALVNVYIPDSVISIGAVAFASCPDLEKISIGSGVTEIGVLAFDGCVSLADIEVSVDNTAYQSIDGNLYSKDGKTIVRYAIGKPDYEFILPEKVTAVGEHAFNTARNLVSITLGRNLTKINNFAFQNCDKLVEVVNRSAMRLYAGRTDDGYVAYYAKEVHGANASKVVNSDGLLFFTYQGASYFLGYAGDSAEIVLPESYNGAGYEIYRYALYRNSSITSVTLGAKVSKIGNYAFADCTALQSVNIPLSVKNIGAYAFDGCTSLLEARFEGLDYWRLPNGKYIYNLSDTQTAAESLALTYASKEWKWG